MGWRAGPGGFDTNMVNNMHLRRLRLVFGVVGVFVFAGLGFAADVPRKTLHGHVPPAAAKLASFGALPATNRLSLAIGLPQGPENRWLSEVQTELFQPLHRAVMVEVASSGYCVV